MVALNRFLLCKPGPLIPSCLPTYTIGIVNDFFKTPKARFKKFSPVSSWLRIAKLVFLQTQSRVVSVGSVIKHISFIRLR